MSKCADCCTAAGASCGGGRWGDGRGGSGGGDRLGPGTFFKPPLIRASVRGSPGWSELPQWRQSEAAGSAPRETKRDGSQTRGRQEMDGGNAKDKLLSLVLRGWGLAPGGFTVWWFGVVVGVWIWGVRVGVELVLAVGRKGPNSGGRIRFPNVCGVRLS